MTDDLIILILWELGCLCFGLWGMIVINEVFDVIQRTAESENKG